MGIQVKPHVTSYYRFQRSARSRIAALVSSLLIVAPAATAYALRGSLSAGLPNQGFVNEKGARAQTGNDLQGLEPGKPIERELAGGQTHSYQFTLASGQYIHLIVDQRGIDVLVTVT